MPEFSIDRGRLFAILDDGQAAAAQSRGLNDEYEALREALHKLETGDLISRQTSRHNESAPQTARRIAATKAQMQRLQDRRAEAAEVINPKLALARRAREYAAARGLAEEVRGYVA